MSSEPATGPPIQRISLMTAIMIVVANMIGTAVFVSLGYQVFDLTSGFTVLILWAVGAIASFCGAVCYAELAAMRPRSGGEYHLLGDTFHPLAGFLTGWISVTVGFAAPIAIAAFAFGEYFGGVFQGILPESAGVWLKPNRLAIVVVLLVTFIHLGGIKLASRFQVVFTVAKVLLICVLIGCGFLVANPKGDMSFLPPPDAASQIFSKSFAVSLYWVMYAYTGWNAAAYVAGEMDRPQRNVPLALVIGTALVTVLYLALNAAFMYSTPREAMMGQSDVARVAAIHIFGESGGRIVGGLICFGLISTISAMVWAGPRVTQVMGEDYRLFRFLSNTNRAGSPTIAIIVQSAIVILLLWTMTFEETLYYVQALLTLSSMLTVLGIFYARWKDPGAVRTYRAFGYPVTPILFGIVSVWMLYSGVAAKPKPSVLGVGTLVVGFIVYLVCVATNRSAKVAAPDGEAQAN